jgi:hypothetical protein
LAGAQRISFAMRRKRPWPSIIADLTGLFCTGDASSAQIGGTDPEHFAL